MRRIIEKSWEVHVKSEKRSILEACLRATKKLERSASTFEVKVLRGQEWHIIQQLIPSKRAPNQINNAAEDFGVLQEVSWATWAIVYEILVEKEAQQCKFHH